MTRNLENVLLLQGGGSLGAFGCGVYKALLKNNINLDIIAGTSIGGINAAIIAGTKNEEKTEELLENFWMELSESFIDLEKFASSSYWSSLIARNFFPDYDFLKFISTEAAAKGAEINDRFATKTNKQKIKINQLKSFYSSAIFGNDKMFVPRWSSDYVLTDQDYFAPQKWTYMYDHSPLTKTLEKYVDYDKLKPGGNSKIRLILTAVNVLTAEPLTFDSYRQQITPKHILATSAYPLYNFRWVEVEDGVYAWDGSLLSNTPSREVIAASPVKDKMIVLVENYPPRIDSLPENLPEVYHRARDIMFSDKSKHSVKMSKVISMYLNYMEELYQIVENNIDKIQLDEKQLKRIRRKYRKYKLEHGAEIKEIYYITRDEPHPHLYENADFRPETIKNSIREGEEKANKIIKENKRRR
ncbi:MAG: patatin-like phospholipase family protein [Candidatus Nitrosocosmicus sp.]|nr:patatin-like phospholipase family protein [Candidatus Nitrosocosmicus sp.]MDN5866852.1 patatin-like phospholipase family protein [Candidatus Nitrosocosmicus sp.]